MEKFQGPTNHCHFYGGGHEHLNVESSTSLEHEGSGLDFSYGSSSFLNTESFRFQEQEEEEDQVLNQTQHQHSFLIPTFEEKMPFLQMLQSVESPPYSPFPEQTHFQLLLKLQQQQQQQQQPWVETKYKYLTEMDSRIQALELESCITHEISEVHDSPVKSETTNKEQTFPQSSSHLEVVSSFCCNQETNSPENNNNNNNNFRGTSCNWVEKSKTQIPTKASQNSNQVVVARERRKRKRTRPSKNREEVETQRMTHIAVERNRRRQMNDHLNALRSLMPTSFIQRGDQASIIGGAIDFVKELEQLLQSLQAKKRMRSGFSEQEGEEPKKKKNKRCDDDDGDSLMAFNGFFTSPQYTSYSSLFNGDNDDDVKEEEEEEEEEEEMDKKKYRRDDDENEEEEEEEEEELKEKKNKCVVADIEVIVIQTHVNLKILSPKRPGQLLRAIAALEDLRLTILHLNITSLLQHSVLYSFNLKIEDDCKVGSADEIATAVHQIFSYINNTTNNNYNNTNNN